MKSEILDERISVLSYLRDYVQNFTNFNRILSGLKITFHLNEKLFRRTCNEVSFLFLFYETNEYVDPHYVDVTQHE